MAVTMICWFLISLVFTLLIFSNTIIRALCNTRSSTLPRWKCIIYTDCLYQPKMWWKIKWDCWKRTALYLCIVVNLLNKPWSDLEIWSVASPHSVERINRSVSILVMWSQPWAHGHQQFPEPAEGSASPSMARPRAAAPTIMLLLLISLHFSRLERWCHWGGGFYLHSF